MAVSQVRATVKLGKFKRKVKQGGKVVTIDNDVYTWVRKEVAEHFGMTIEEDAKGGKDNKGVEVRGTKGAGSIRVPTGEKTKGGFTQYYAIPVPSFFKIQDMRNFVKNKITKKKPDRFIAPSGRSYSVGKTTTT